MGLMAQEAGRVVSAAQAAHQEPGETATVFAAGEIKQHLRVLRIQAVAVAMAVPVDPEGVSAATGIVGLRVSLRPRPPHNRRRRNNK